MSKRHSDSLSPSFLHYTYQTKQCFVIKKLLKVGRFLEYLYNCLSAVDCEKPRLQGVEKYSLSWARMSGDTNHSSTERIDF